MNRTANLSPSEPRRPRIFRMHGSCYHHDEVMDAPASHTDGQLAQIAAMGFDGVWLHANLKWLAPTPLFEPYVDRITERMEAMNTVIARAKQHGIGIWLYLNEPRSFPADHSFWTAHPECRGHHHNDNHWDLGWPWAFKRQPCYTMCVSAEPVVRFLREATQSLLTAAPDLAGIVTITNSEHPTHCYSKLGRSKESGCPRCASRRRLDMPLAVLRSMWDGIRASGTGARLAAWTWSWNGLAPDPQQELLDALPPEVALLVDYERGEPVERAGVKYEIDEYAFAIAGPSHRFKQYRQACGEREIWAKLQIGATHELATMPNIPAITCLYDKVAGMRAGGVKGAMTTWTMGLRPTLNSFVAGRLLRHDGELPPRDVMLGNLAREYFDIDNDAAGRAVEAWRQFSDAIQYFPTIMSFCYHSPVNYAPAFPWKLKREGTPMARSWTPEPWGDKIEQSLGRLTMDQAICLLEELATRWSRGIEPYRRALSGGNAHAQQELSVAQACGIFYESCLGAYRFVHAVDTGQSKDTLVQLIHCEMDVCNQAIALLDGDNRLGWHDDFGYMIRPEQIRTKQAGLRQLLAELSTTPA